MLEAAWCGFCSKREWLKERQPRFGVFQLLGGLLILTVTSLLVEDPSRNQGPLASLVKDIRKPEPVALQWQDDLLRYSSTILIAADWLTTVDGLRKGLRETNPLLGPHPSLGRANVLIGAGLLTNAFLVPKIRNEELRRGVWAAVMLLETKALRGNHRAGLRLNFRF